MKLALPLILAAIAALTACKKDAGPGPAGGAPPITSATTDPLWAFAPADLKGAVVVADGVLAALHAGGLRAVADVAKVPGGAEVAAQARQALSGIPIDPFDPAAIAAAGIDLDRGAAVFEGATAKVAVLPVSDAKKLVARFGGTTENGIDRIGELSCRDVKGRYVCADSVASLEVAAKAGGASAVAAWPARSRGHVEAYLSSAELGAGPPLEAPQGVRMAAVLERGAATVRVHLVGKPAGPIAPVRGARSPLADGVADQHPVGVLVVGAARVWDHFRAQLLAGAPAAPLPGGVTIAELAASVRGDVVGHAPPGAPPRGLIRIGLTSEEAMKKLVGACGAAAAALPAGVTVASKDGRCAVTVDPSAAGMAIPGLPAWRADLWVEKGALVIGLGDQTARSDARPGIDPFAAELLAGDWLFATWGRGFLAVAPMLAKALPDNQTGGMVLWAASHLNELGLAMTIADDGIHGAIRVRTLWANPDAVVAAVQAALEPASGDPTAAFQKIAAEHPGSPFARDLQADHAGLTVQAAFLGGAAAVSIPAFMTYIKRSKTAEPRVFLQRLAVAARQHAVEKPGDVQPSAGPTPPLGECCRQGGKCAPEPGRWEAEPWISLRFSVDDAHYYSYEYKVEGNGFTAIARGDLDCDGVYSTFTVRGTTDGPPSEIEAVDELE